MQNQTLIDSMNIFKESLKSYMITEFKAAYGSDWLEKALSPSNTDTQMCIKRAPNEWDIHILVNLMHIHWDQLFMKKLGEKVPRALFTVVRFYRNKWAHQEQLTEREIYRVIDLMQFILETMNQDVQVLELKRTEILVMLTRNTGIYQNSQPKFVCGGCKKYFLAQFRFECYTCGLCACLSCMFSHIASGNPYCPQCNRKLTNDELSIVYTQYHAIFN
jgi:hypothetical protein